MAQGAQGKKAVPTRVRATYVLWEYTELEADFTMKDGSVISGKIRHDNKTSATLAWELPSSLEEALAAFGKKQWSTMDGSRDKIDFDEFDPSGCSDGKACTYYDEDDQEINQGAVEDVDYGDCEDVLGYESTYGGLNGSGLSEIEIEYSDGQSEFLDVDFDSEDCLARLREALTREASQG